MTALPSIYDVQRRMHEATGFEGKRLMAITYAVAAGLADHDVHADYFKKRFGETFAELDFDGASDVIDFIVEREDIRVEPYREI